MAFLIPHVRDGRHSFDVVSRLLEDRIIMMHDGVDNDSAQLVIAQLLYLDSKARGEPIQMYLDSPGGSVISGLGIIDTIGIIESPVHMYSIGMSASMGFMLLVHGAKGHRYATPNSQIMLHQVSSGTRGTVADMEIDFAHAKLLNEKLMRMISSRTKMSLAKVKKLCERDAWLSAEQALELGVIDEILTAKWK